MSLGSMQLSYGVAETMTVTLPLVPGRHLLIQPGVQL